MDRALLWTCYEVKVATLKDKVLIAIKVAIVGVGGGGGVLSNCQDRTDECA